MRWPALDACALDRVVLDYDPEIDPLYVFLTGSPVPAVQIPMSDGDTYVGVRLLPNDSPTDEAVTVMVEAFRRRALAIHRDWQDPAELVPMTPGARPAPAEPPIERRAILSHFTAEVAAMGVA